MFVLKQIRVSRSFRFFSVCRRLRRKKPDGPAGELWLLGRGLGAPLNVTSYNNRINIVTSVDALAPIHRTSSISRHIHHPVSLFFGPFFSFIALLFLSISLLRSSRGERMTKTAGQRARQRTSWFGCGLQAPMTSDRHPGGSWGSDYPRGSFKSV